MGYNIEAVKLPGKFLDRRVKLLDCQKERISQMYNLEGVTIKNLSRLFGVCQRTIRFIAIPETEKRAKELHKQRQSDGRYKNKERDRKSRESTRKYKEDLFKQFDYDESRNKRKN